MKYVEKIIYFVSQFRNQFIRHFKTYIILANRALRHVNDTYEIEKHISEIHVMNMKVQTVKSTVGKIFIKSILLFK